MQEEEIPNQTDQMYRFKSERSPVKNSEDERISDWGGESRVADLGASFYDSIGMKGMDGDSRCFTINFSEHSLRGGDYCKYTKTSEMRVDEFWEELTATSRESVRELVIDAKTRGFNSFRSKVDQLEIMFRMPEVVIGLPDIQYSSFLGKPL